eukprot:UN22823
MQPSQNTTNTVQEEHPVQTPPISIQNHSRSPSGSSSTTTSSVPTLQQVRPYSQSPPSSLPDFQPQQQAGRQTPKTGQQTNTPYDLNRVDQLFLPILQSKRMGLGEQIRSLQSFLQQCSNELNKIEPEEEHSHGVRSKMENEGECQQQESSDEIEGLVLQTQTDNQEEG